MRSIVLRVAAVAVLGVPPLPGARLLAASGPAPSRQVDIRESSGVYTVTARFEVPQAPAVALAVLSDYEQIPRFMPDVRTSVVRERAPGRLVVEQQAEPQKVHLVLQVTESGDTIRFKDRCGKASRRTKAPGARRTTTAARS